MVNQENQIQPQLSLSGYEFVLTEEGEWICKAMPEVSILPRKVKKNTASKYPAQNVIEQDYANDFSTCLAAATKDIAKYLMG
jgi:hypothetical protein